MSGRKEISQEILPIKAASFEDFISKCRGLRVTEVHAMPFSKFEPEIGSSHVRYRGQLGIREFTGIYWANTADGRKIEFKEVYHQQQGYEQDVAVNFDKPALWANQTAKTVNTVRMRADRIKKRLHGVDVWGPVEGQKEIDRELFISILDQPTYSPYNIK